MTPDVSEGRGAVIFKYQAMSEEILFVPENDGNTALRNIGSHSPSNTLSHPSNIAVRTARASLVLHSLIMLFQVQSLMCIGPCIVLITVTAFGPETQPSCLHLTSNQQQLENQTAYVVTNAIVVSS